MSRIAKKPVEIGIAEVVKNDKILSFKGPLGAMQLKLPEDLVVNIDNEKKLITVDGEVPMALKGTFVRLIGNAITGVTKSFEKKVKLSGVGYKAALEGKKIKLTIGLSHDVFVEIPEDIKVTLPNISNLTITSCNKELLGMFVDKLCKSKRYNVYNGTGVLEIGKFYRHKETKKK